MIDIEKACQDNEARYYAAVFFDNAAMVLLGGTFCAPPFNTPQGRLVAYNIHRADGYHAMEKDPNLPRSIKSIARKIKEKHPSSESDFSYPHLDGWYVIRTPAPLAGSELRGVLKRIERALNSGFYSKSLGMDATIRYCLKKEMVYRI